MLSKILVTLLQELTTLNYRLYSWVHELDT